MGANLYRTDDDLADILADFIRGSIDRVRGWTEELDDQYAAPISATDGEPNRNHFASHAA